MFRLKSCRHAFCLLRHANQTKIQVNLFSKTNSLADNVKKNVPNNAHSKDEDSKKAITKTAEKPKDSNAVEKWLEKYNQASHSTIKKTINEYLEVGHINRAIQLHKHQSEKNNDFKLNFLDHLKLINGAVDKGFLLDAEYLLEKVKRDDGILWKSDTTRAVINIFKSLKSQNVSRSEFRKYENYLVFAQTNVPRQVLESLMFLHLADNGDVGDAVDLFKRIAEKFKKTCYQQKLLSKLIENESVKEMREVVDICSGIHTKENSIKSLAMALIECGQIDQAKKLFESQKINDDNQMLKSSMDFHMSRGEVQILKGMLIALENCKIPKTRRDIYTNLLKIYEKKGDLDKVKSLIVQMDGEQLMPDIRLRDRLVDNFSRNGLDIPKSWFEIDDDYGSQLDCLLKADQMEEANKLFCKLLDDKKAQPLYLLHYFFLKNSKKGIISIFEHLSDKLDAETKKQLNYNAYECDAYRNAGKPDEYIKLLRQKLTLTENSKGSVYDVTGFTVNIIELISKYPQIYDEYKKMATEIAEKSSLKPITFLWACNFINGINDTDNQFIWKKYFSKKSTYICSKMSRILYDCKEISKLREFLNLRTLNKLHISPKVLGESYGFLFRVLIKYNKDYDTVILELKKIMNLISKNDLNATTKNAFKSCPRDVSDKIYNILNSDSKSNINYEK